MLIAYLMIFPIKKLSINQMMMKRERMDEERNERREREKEPRNKWRDESKKEN
jgi:hypothetical protein